MGRSLSEAAVSPVLNASVNSVQNPYSGVFGSGNVRIYAVSETFIVPATSVRVRCFGAAGEKATGGGGGGGGFAMETLTGLTIGASVSITVGDFPAGTSSFGAYLSATGGNSAVGDTGGTGGTGVGGTINYTGGSGGRGSGGQQGGGGGGVANLFGNGGNGGGNYKGQSAASGGGGGAYNSTTLYAGGNGAFGSGTSGLTLGEVWGVDSIDYIGTGGGGLGVGTQNTVTFTDGINGGGDGAKATSGGAGGGGVGKKGLVIVEW